MTSYEEQAQLRAHLSELRKAARGLGSDFEVRFEEVGAKIERLPSLTAKEARQAFYDIEDDFGALARSIDGEVRRLPREIGHGIAVGVGGIKHGATRLGEATRDGLDAAGHRAAEGTRNALAAAAGVRRTPMRQWSEPSTDSSSDDGQ